MLQAVLAFMGNPAPIISYPLVRLGNDIQDSEFNNDILDTLVPDLVPNFSEFKFLRREV